jgi:hypothetical protein
MKRRNLFSSEILSKVPIYVTDPCEAARDQVGKVSLEFHWSVITKDFPQEVLKNLGKRFETTCPDEHCICAAT